MAKADLLLKLSYMKDECTTEKPKIEGHIRYFFATLTGKLSAFFKINIVYILIFCLPFIFLVWGLPTIMENYVMKGYSFIGNFGIGYPGNNVETSVAITELYSWHYKLILPLVFPTLFLVVFGLSGVSHCARGLMWGEKVKPFRSFFNGIRLLYKPFLLLSTITSILGTGVAYAITWQVELLKLSAATPASWSVFIIAILIAFLYLCLLIYIIPLISCYRFSFGKVIKNAALLSIVYWLQTISLAVLTTGIFCLFMVKVISIILGIFLATVGMIAFIGAWTVWGQEVFEFTIGQLQLSSEKGGSVVAKKAKKDYKGNIEKQETVTTVQNNTKNNNVKNNNQKSYRPPYKKNKKGKR